jgi:hypothetical protein
MAEPNILLKALKTFAPVIMNPARDLSRRLRLMNEKATGGLKPVRAAE